MKTRRTKKDELEKRRPTFLLIGLVIALGLTYGMLNLKTQARLNIHVNKAAIVSFSDEFNTPRTFQKQKEQEVKQEIENTKKKLQEQFIEVPNEAMVPLENTIGIDEPLEEIPQFREDPILEIDIYALEKMPVFPGCEDLLNEEERFNCFVEQVSRHVVNNFKPCEGAFGVNKERLYIQFTIDENGRVTAAKAIRGDDECNIDRAVFVVNELPQMKPGEYRGKTVRTRFVLPINIK
jgi:protein TonB